MIAAAVERGASTLPLHSGCQLLDSVVADALSHPSPFASLLPSLPLPQLLQQSALPVLMCCWPTPYARDGGSAADGCDPGSIPGRADPLRGFELFSMIVGNIQVRFQRLPPLAMRLATAAAFFIGCSPDVS